MTKGKLIVFEGLDGCGKSTQAEMLVVRLVKSGRRARLVHFPAYASSTGQLIASHLRGEKQATPREMSLLYALDKYEYVPTLQKMLDQGITVVLDRYTASNCAYQSARFANAAKRGEFMRWILVLELYLPKPDIEFFIDVDPSISFQKNLAKKGRKYLGGKKDVYEKDMHFQSSVRKQYLALSKMTQMTVIVGSEKGKMLERKIVQDAVLRELSRAGLLAKAN